MRDEIKKTSRKYRLKLSEASKLIVDAHKVMNENLAKANEKIKEVFDLFGELGKD